MAKNTSGLNRGNPGHKGAGGRPSSEVVAAKKDFTLDNMEEAQKSFDKIVFLRDNSSNESIVLDASKAIIERLLGKSVQPLGNKDDGLADLGKILRQRYGV